MLYDDYIDYINNLLLQEMEEWAFILHESTVDALTVIE